MKAKLILSVFRILGLKEILSQFTMPTKRNKALPSEKVRSSVTSFIRLLLISINIERTGRTFDSPRNHRIGKHCCNKNTVSRK